MANRYRKTDAGAPAWPANIGHDTVRYFLSVIKACLVDGFGANPGAGWTVVYEDLTTDKERLALSNGNGTIEFVTWDDDAIALFIWDSITTPGTGAVYTDPYASVISAGINGWQASQAPVSTDDTKKLALIYTYYFQGAFYEDQIDWTVYADDKSAWFYGHYPDGNASAETTDTIATSTSYHPCFFIGAVDSSDLLKDQFGNFFIGYGSEDTPNSTPSANIQNAANRWWGLRSPFNVEPVTTDEFELAPVNVEPYNMNYFSSYRFMTPMVIRFDGANMPFPAGMTSTYRTYEFGAVPGIVQVANDNASAPFWRYLSTDFSSTWNLEEHTLNGITMMPIDPATSFGASGITTDPSWWT